MTGKEQKASVELARMVCDEDGLVMLPKTQRRDDAVYWAKDIAAERKRWGTEIANLKKQLKAVVIQNEGNHRKALAADKNGYARGYADGKQIYVCAVCGKEEKRDKQEGLSAESHSVKKVSK